MICKECLRLIPGYLDGELSEAQSAPLRQHLIDCPECRKAASGEKAFERWFAGEGPEVTVPDGFAARVARRAFAGDIGERSAATVGAEAETPILRFVLRATAVAAVLLLLLTAWMRSVQRAEGPVQATTTPSRPLEVILRDLRERQLRLQESAAKTEAARTTSPEETPVEEAPAEEGDR